MNWLKRIPQKFIFWILFTQILGILGIEVWLNSATQTISDNATLINQSLHKASQAFELEKQNLVEISKVIAIRLQERGLVDANLISAFAPHILLITKNDTLIHWSKHAPDIYRKKELIPQLGFSRLDYLGKTYLSYTISPSSDFRIHVLRLISDINAESIRNKRSYTILSDWLSTLDFPVQLELQPVELDENNPIKKPLYISDTTVLGTLVSYPDSRSLLDYHWNAFKSRIRSLYTLFFVLVSVVVFTVASKQWNLSSRILFRIPLLFILWLLLIHSEAEFQLTDILIEWGWQVKRSLTIQLLRLQFHVFFFVLISYECIRAARIQKRFFGITWYPRTLILSLIFGGLTYFSLTSLPASYLHLIDAFSIELLDPNLFPPFEALLFILGLSASFGTGILLSFTCNTFLINSEQDQEIFVYPFHALGFLGAHYFLYFTGLGYANEYHFPWSVVGLYVGLLAASSLFWRNPSWLNRVSLIRKILVGTFLLSLFLYPVIYNRYQELNKRDFEVKVGSLVEDFLDFMPFTTTSSPIYNHDQGAWPGNVYIAAYDSNQNLKASWNRQLLPFSEEIKLSLNARELDALKQGVSIERSLFFEKQPFGEYLIQLPKSGYIIRRVFPIIPFQSHVFSFFRFFYISLLTVISLLMIRSLVTQTPLPLFDSKEKLQSRILDTYIVASLLFLIALVGTTGIIVSNQEKASLQTLIKEKKEAVITAIKQDFYGKFDKPFMQFLANRFQVSLELFVDKYSILDVPFGNDQSLINKGELINPSVHESLFKQNKLEVELWESEGIETFGTYYIRPNVNPNRKEVLKISLKQINRSNYEQLVETVSYLIAVYVFIFTFFIVLAFFISKYLANPLQRLLQGLKRISSGKLDTIVPVTTHDEIGELANAYNFMVFRLKDLQKELAEVEREAAWSEMARQVAHEIKNPLTPMKLSLQHLQRLVKQESENAQELKLSVERISENLIQQIDSLAAIASDFSQFAKPLTDELSPLNLNQVILDINELYQHDSLIRIKLDLSEKALIILGVTDDLKRVLINLIKNAIEAMPNGGIIVIRTYSYKKDAFIEIADTGSGIPIDVQKHIFKPNFSTKTSGTGIGLAICKKVVDAHSGTIQFASVPGAGTTFTLSFPLQSV